MVCISKTVIIIAYKKSGCKISENVCNRKNREDKDDKRGVIPEGCGIIGSVRKQK